jgi:hypothetical protein
LPFVPIRAVDIGFQSTPNLSAVRSFRAVI